MPHRTKMPQAHAGYKTGTMCSESSLGGQLAADVRWSVHKRERKFSQDGTHQIRIWCQGRLRDRNYVLLRT